MLSNKHLAAHLAAIIARAIASTRLRTVSGSMNHLEHMVSNMTDVRSHRDRPYHSSASIHRRQPLLSHQRVSSIHTTATSLATTYYDMLGVSRSASDSEIKKAFYKLAKKYHPDTNQGDPTAAKKFQEVQQAYDTLRDPQKRAAYDQLGHSAYEAAEAGGGAPGGGPFGAGGTQVDPEELFREFFGSNAGRAGGFQGTIFEHIFGGGFGGAAGGGGFGARMRRGASIQAGLTISFEEAVKGTTKQIDPSSLGIPGTPSSSGRIDIKIPPGVDNGFQLRVDGRGMPGPQGTPPGDLLIQVRVLPSGRFERDGFDLYTEVKVNFADAALGTSVDVPTVDGRAEVRIKPGTQPGDKLRMRGYGVPMDLMGVRGRKGDQYVIVRVTVPRTLTQRQRDLLEAFRSGGEVPSNSRASSDGSGSATNTTTSPHSSNGNGSSDAITSDDDAQQAKSEGDDKASSTECDVNKKKEEREEPVKKKKKGWFF